MINYIQTAFNNSFQKKPIDSLDGLRAISILLVIIGHSSFMYSQNFSELGSYFAIMQGLGVTIFFLLSGFLINFLLLKEKNKNGFINFKVFYLKRLLRIFPPFYLYVLCSMYYSYHFLELPSVSEIISALTFTWNYVLSTHSWLLGHSWSLSVEEQFYLTWPWILSFFTLKKSKKFAVWLIALSPLLRIFTYFLFPEMRARTSIMLHTRIDSLMVGCLLAFYYFEFYSVFKKYISKYYLTSIALIFLFIVNPILRIQFQGKYFLPIGYSLENLAIGVILISTITLPKKSYIFWILNNPLLRQIGVLSYGLYLWQQFYLFHDIKFEFQILRFILLYFTALCLFMFFEYPISQYSKRLQKKLSQPL